MLLAILSGAFALLCFKWVAAMPPAQRTAAQNHLNKFGAISAIWTKIVAVVDVVRTILNWVGSWPVEGKIPDTPVGFHHNTSQQFKPKTPADRPEAVAVPA